MAELLLDNVDDFKVAVRERSVTMVEHIEWDDNGELSWYGGWSDVIISIVYEKRGANLPLPPIYIKYKPIFLSNYLFY